MRKVPPDQRPHRGFGRVVGRRYRIEGAPTAFVLDTQGRAKKREDGLAGGLGQLIGKG